MIPPEPPPASLFERLARGEAEAMDEICRRYGRRVYNLARRGVRGALRGYVESSDIARESLAAVVRDAPRCRFDSEAAFLGWLRRIVEHRIRAAAKHRQGRAAHDDGEPRRPACDDESAGRIAMRREAGDEVAIALARLPAGDRALLIARAILKLPWDAIARFHDQRKTALQMRYMRVRRRLAKALARWDSTSSGVASLMRDTT